MKRIVVEFERHRPAILTAATNMYFAEKSGEELPEDLARVMLPQNVGDASEQAMRLAEAEEARVNVAARAIARMAGLRDLVEERGMIRGLPALIEVGLTTIIDRSYLGGELGEDGLVEQVRGNVS